MGVAVVLISLRLQKPSRAMDACGVGERMTRMTRKLGCPCTVGGRLLISVHVRRSHGLRAGARGARWTDLGEADVEPPGVLLLKRRSHEFSLKLKVFIRVDDWRRGQQARPRDDGKQASLKVLHRRDGSSEDALPGSWELVGAEKAPVS